MSFKICNKCKISKEFKHFAQQKTGKRGLRASCKECVRNAYSRSKKGVGLAMFNNQVHKSIKRGHTPPAYTKDDLIAWLMSKDEFHTMYDNWVESGHEMQNKPTCDRINDYLPYSFSNIQLKTFKENSEKYYKDAIEGINTKACKKVGMFTLDNKLIKEFHSLASAAREVKTSHSNIRNVCEKIPLKRKDKNGSIREFTPKTSKGYIWKYI